MKRCEDIVDRLLQETIGDGDISHLPGAGKPLKLRDESHTPAELRAAHKIMGDHEVAPDWIAAGSQLDQLEASLRQQINQRAARYLREQEWTAESGHADNSKHIEETWNRYTLDYIERVGRYNREALLFNLKVPKGIQHRQILSGEHLIKRALGSTR